MRAPQIVNYRRRPRALPTLLAVLPAAPAFYGFLALILGWFLLIAGRLWQLTRSAAPQIP